MSTHKVVIEDLLELLTENRIEEFFQQWKVKIHPTSPLNGDLRRLRADWVEAQQRSIRGENQDDVIRRIRNRAFSLVENITQGDLEEQSTPDPGPSPQPLSPQEAKYRELAQNKLAHLRNARLLATDPSMMFKLDQEIAELEKLLG
jgi:hypothetical protein